MNRVRSIAVIAAVLLAACTSATEGTFCDLESDWNRFVSTDLSALSQAELQTTLEDTGEFLDRAVELAPSEIRDDVERFAEAMDAALDLYADAGYDVTEIDPEEVRAFVEGHEAAARRSEDAIVQWTRGNCGP